jgi:hypothetical protein
MEVVIHLKVPVALLALVVLLDLVDPLDLVDLLDSVDLVFLLDLVDLLDLALVDLVRLPVDLADLPVLLDTVLHPAVLLDLVLLDTALHPAVLLDLALLPAVLLVDFLLLNHGKETLMNSNMLVSTTDKRIMYPLQMYHLMNSSYLYKLPMHSDKPTTIEMVN